MNLWEKMQQGNPVYLKDLWPSKQEIEKAMQDVSQNMFSKEYSEVFAGDEQWKAIPMVESTTYAWQKDSTYVQDPPYFVDMSPEPKPVTDIREARILALLGDSVTTDHISPAGSIKVDSPAGKYLQEKGVKPKDFNSYGARRGNHEVMMRGTFANIRIRNEMTPGIEGGVTAYYPDNKVLSIFDAAMKYKDDGVPLVIVAGREYGTGSSRDWAAKGPLLLGVKAVIAESFERIHRSNLIGMGILPLEFKEGVTRKTLGLQGKEKINLEGFVKNLRPQTDCTMKITRENGETESVPLRIRIDTQNEATYFQQGGILHYMLRQMLKKSV